MFYNYLIHPKTYNNIPLNTLQGKYLLNYYILKGGRGENCPEQFLAQMDPITQIRDFYYKKEFISACNYCQGRDYRTATIEAAVQTKEPLEFKTYV